MCTDFNKFKFQTSLETLLSLKAFELQFDLTIELLK